MSLIALPNIPGLRRTAPGKHRADDAIAQRDERIRDLTADNQALNRENDETAADLQRLTVRSCQDAIRIAQIKLQLDAAVREVRRLGDKVIRAEVEHRRLRQAVVDARPRIRAVDTQLVRPYAPEVVLPYVSPVPVPVERSSDEDPGWE
ncbi:hypothetical protein [Streptomyces formicae]|uniref:Uncharacterized protein n=1 Tax=Streptomyces formicae TaxID=1616117 RepID=A0ABY3WTJ4_9ACTN|nr:hypothetical protein [Streptomyces formicae]UNM13821.1 hypothetical protein J4032_22265 [Streptomyces formicae]